MNPTHERRRHSAAAQAIATRQGLSHPDLPQDDLAAAALNAADQAMVIVRVEQLEALSVGARIWGAAPLLPDTPGTGRPYYRETDGTWFDYRANACIPSADIMLPALLVKEKLG